MFVKAPSAIQVPLLSWQSCCMILAWFGAGRWRRTQSLTLSLRPPLSLSLSLSLFLSASSIPPPPPPLLHQAREQSSVTKSFAAKTCCDYRTTPICAGNKTLTRQNGLSKAKLAHSIYIGAGWVVDFPPNWPAGLLSGFTNVAVCQTPNCSTYLAVPSP